MAKHTGGKVGKVGKPLSTSKSKGKKTLTAHKHNKGTSPRGAVRSVPVGPTKGDNNEK